MRRLPPRGPRPKPGQDIREAPFSSHHGVFCACARTRMRTQPLPRDCGLCSLCPLPSPVRTHRGQRRSRERAPPAGNAARVCVATQIARVRAHYSSGLGAWSPKSNSIALGVPEFLRRRPTAAGAAAPARP